MVMKLLNAYKNALTVMVIARLEMIVVALSPRQKKPDAKVGLLGRVGD
jgi:hypothetical protein